MGANQATGNSDDIDSLFYYGIQNTLNTNTAHYPMYDYETHWSLQYMVSSQMPNLTAAQGYEHAKTLAMADAALQNNDYGTALSLTNSFSPANIIESNWQSVNNIIIKMQASSQLSSADKSTLQHVASQCYLTGGNIVWRARAILNSYYDMIAEYPNTCPVNNGDGNRVQNATQVSKINNSINQLNLYPNPSNGKLYISNFTSNQKSADIEVNDITGKIITKQQSVINAGVIELNLDVNSGIYFIKVITNGNTQVQKIIINK